MFAELFFFCLTVVGLVLLDKVSVIIGITVLSVLTYLCAAKCIREGADKFVSHSVKYYDQYLQVIGSFSHRLIFSWRWYYFFKQIKALTYLVRAARQVDESGSSENVAFGNTGVNSRKVPDHCGSDLSVDDEIRTIVDRILKEYIKSWYCGKISQNKDFVNDVDCVIRDTLIALCGGIAKADRKQFMCHAFQVYLHYFFHFKQALNKVITDETVLEICLMKKKEILQNFEMHHWAMKDEITEWSYLQSIMGTLIDSFGPVELLSCPLLHTVVVEILTQNVMYPLVNILTDPDRLNSWLAKLLQNVLRIEIEKLSINDIAIENNIIDSSAPSIFISDETTTTVAKPEILPQNCLHTEAQTINDANFCSNSSFSDLDNSSNISCQTGDISFDKLSAISSESSDGSKLTPDKVPAVSGMLFHKRSDDDDDDEEEEEETKINYLVFSPINGRARSNSNVSNNPDNISVQSDHREDSKFLEVTQMKRSKSADFIRHMPNRSNLLPLNTLNHSIRYCGKTNRNFLQLKPEVLPLGDVEIAEEAIEKEVPPLFSDVKIVNTQQQEDSGHKPYTLYCIQYNGVFQNMSSGSHFPELVQQVVNIKRRFREFHALHSRLEDNPLLKGHLKGIKGPSKWLATPFANLDKKNIAERKVFLESYLQALCKRDPIAKSQELQEFLAYGGDASIAYVKKPTDINVPRIDKFIVRGVKGAIDLFRTALPGTSETGVTKEPNPCVPDVPVDESSSETKFQVYVVDYSKRGPEILKHIKGFFKHFDSNSSTESLYDDCIPFDTAKGSLRRGSLLQHSHSINDSDGCSCSGTLPVGVTSREDTLLAHLVMDLIVESFPQKSFISHVLKFLPISFLQSFLDKKLHEISEEKCARLLHMFHMALWPEVEPIQKSQWNHNMVNALHGVLNEQFEALLSTKYFGELLNKPLGSNTSYAIELLLGSIQHGQLNRCLLFYLLDVIIQILCSKEQ